MHRCTEARKRRDLFPRMPPEEHIPVCCGPSARGGACGKQHIPDQDGPGGQRSSSERVCDMRRAVCICAGRAWIWPESSRERRTGVNVRTTLPRDYTQQALGAAGNPRIWGHIGREEIQRLFCETDEEDTRLIVRASMVPLAVGGSGEAEERNTEFFAWVGSDEECAQGGRGSKALAPLEHGIEIGRYSVNAGSNSLLKALPPSKAPTGALRKVFSSTKWELEFAFTKGYLYLNFERADAHR
ncbi:hypothetical protein DFH07DRAFT_774215 [Mycena maculata]|uniref:Uncharacterized protein n=1 Tax=Mycena maculata TaxID=230809 RepID=A0AAD7NAX3_9AGAR|nr:hypothetical protein DFH07DRAFT_774215 [Mycena maculata]